MQAATVTEFGTPDVLQIREVTDLEPGRGQVVVAVEYADTLWLETQVRAGAGQDYWPQRPPYVPGQGVSGRVSAVGDGVAEALLGRRVAARTGGEGGYATQVVVAADALVDVPDDVGLDQAAAVLHDAVTALALMYVTKQGTQDAVVVLGASGGLGIASVQLARSRAGATVAVARGAKLARVADLGATAVVDSEADDWIDQVRAALPDGTADVVLDNIGGDLGESAFALMGPGGRFSGHGTPSGRFAEVNRHTARARDITVTGIEAVQLDDETMRVLTRQGLEAVRTGELSPVIGQVFPLDRAADAHAAIESRAVFGTTLLRTGT